MELLRTLIVDEKVDKWKSTHWFSNVPMPECGLSRYQIFLLKRENISKL